MNPRLKNLALGVAVGMVASFAALAQPGTTPAPAFNEILPPPQVRDLGAPPTLWNVILFGLLIALGVGANCIPSKRGHQD